MQGRPQYCIVKLKVEAGVEKELYTTRTYCDPLLSLLLPVLAGDCTEDARENSKGTSVYGRERNEPFCRSGNWVAR